MRNVSVFHLGNIADTCAVWNVLSSMQLLGAARARNCEFAVTGFVVYECLSKARSRSNTQDEELKNRLMRERKANRFREVPLSLEDVQEVATLTQRRRLGHGELASIAFAKRTRSAFCSDDRNAQKLAEAVLGLEWVQTTPHLLGWLVFEGVLGDTDVEEIIQQHESVGRPLARHFKTMHHEGLRCRLMARSNSDLGEREPSR